MADRPTNRAAQTDAVEGLLLDAVERGQVDVDRAEGIVAQLLGQLRTATPPEAVNLVPVRGPARYLPDHVLNVTRLGLYVALQSGWAEAEIALTGMAALWHDVGMLQLPPWRWLQERLLEPEDLRAIRAHAADGAALLERVAAWPPRVPRIVAQVHERFDGSGYPAGLAGDDIDPVARLLAVCDTYEALVSPRLYRAPFPPIAAMRVVLAEADAQKLDPGAVRDFVSAVGLYPCGSLVKLDDGSQARVVAPNGETPGRPIVEVIVDGAGQPLTMARRVDLSQNPHLGIAG